MEGQDIRIIFKTAPTFGFRAFILAMLALTCVLFDRNDALFHQWRESAERIVTPVRAVVNQPIEWIHQLIQGATLQKNLVEENDHLREQQIIMQSQMQSLLELQRENKQLNALLKSSANVTGRVKVAKLLAVSLDPSLQQFILNKGKADKVYIGQPVFDAYGVMGQIVDLSHNTSKVLLITDQKSAIPVEDYRNGMRAIVTGTGDKQTLKLINVPILSKIKKGDLFVTSGYAQHFPQGYPVGIVDSVVHHVGQKFLLVTLLPSAHLDQTQRVLLVWPSQLKLRKQVEQLIQRQQFPLPKATQP